MSLTDFQAGLMLGAAGGFTVGGLLVLVAHGASLQRTMKRIREWGRKP